MARYAVIDADGHVEPALAVDWTKYAPAASAEKIRKLGGMRFSYGGDRSGSRRGAWDARARLPDMDEEGIDIAALYGGLIGLGVPPDPDPSFGVAYCRAYNTWLSDYCGVAPDRLKGVALLPVVNIDAACEELRRAVGELGFVAGVLRPVFADRPLDDPYFFPVYAQAENLDVALTVHSPGVVWEVVERRYPTHFKRHALDFTVSIMAACMDVVCGGVLEHFKSLRVAFLEGGVGWLPFWMQRLDEHYEKLPHHVPIITKKPSEYFRESRVFFSCEPDEYTLPYIVDVVGADHILYASDYDHWDCSFPDSVKHIAQRKALSPTAKRKILGENASRLYKLPLPSLGKEPERESKVPLSGQR